MIYSDISALVNYGMQKGLLRGSDREWALNAILEILCMEEFEEQEEEQEDRPLNKILAGILSWAVEKGLISNSLTEKDLLDTRLMGVLTPRPSEVNDVFSQLYEESPQNATDYFYSLSMDTDYIRRYRVEMDLKWSFNSPYGELDITINLSKPEKDPKEIAAAKNAKQSGYPKCMLCKENIGYHGRLNHPARQNLRAVPVTINSEEWYFQYSPYVYYNEHCIVFNGEHVPMRIDKSTFRKLLDFVKSFPHYFVGSNADLPIVGGSILSHDHFQGGNYCFAMERAPVEKKLEFMGFDDVKAGIVNWPMSVIRLTAASDKRLVELGDKILKAWRVYTDKAAFIFANTEGEPHNTITPIARRRGDLFELDLVLRNNICTAEHPLGVYHPHSELHHIKKENIGLIEVMGLAVLPSRLKTEMAILADCLKAGEALPDSLAAHEPWAEEIKEKYPKLKALNVEEILEQEIGLVFTKVLEHAGVFKCTGEGRRAFARFVDSVNG